MRNQSEELAAVLGVSRQTTGSSKRGLLVCFDFQLTLKIMNFLERRNKISRHDLDEMQETWYRFTFWGLFGIIIIQSLQITAKSYTKKRKRSIVSIIQR